MGLVCIVGTFVVLGVVCVVVGSGDLFLLWVLSVIVVLRCCGCSLVGRCLGVVVLLWCRVVGVV